MVLLRGEHADGDAKAYLQARDRAVNELLEMNAKVDGLSGWYTRKPLVYHFVRTVTGVLPDEMPSLTLPSCALLLCTALPEVHGCTCPGQGQQGSGPCTAAAGDADGTAMKAAPAPRHSVHRWAYASTPDGRTASTRLAGASFEVR